MHRAALGHLPLLRLAMHTLILLSKFKQRTKNDTKKYGRKTHAVPIPVVPFRFFPGTTRLPVLVVHFFLFPKAISKVARLARLFLQLLLSSALDSSDSVELLADKGRRYKHNGRELNS